MLYATESGASLPTLGVRVAYSTIISALALHKLARARPLFPSDVYLLIHSMLFAWGQGPPDAWLLQQLLSLGSVFGSGVAMAACFLIVLGSIYGLMKW
jgi:hypothetical protein